MVDYKMIESLALRRGCKHECKNIVWVRERTCSSTSHSCTAALRAWPFDTPCLQSMQMYLRYLKVSVLVAMVNITLLVKKHGFGLSRGDLQCVHLFYC